MGPETKKHDNDQTNKQTNIIYSLFAIKTELSSDKIDSYDTIIYIKI